MESVMLQAGKCSWHDSCSTRVGKREKDEREERERESWPISHVIDLYGLS